MIHPSASVHQTAIIEDGARIGAGCRIGAYCVVGAHAELGESVELVSHVVISGHTTIGPGTKIWPFASIGSQPQDLKFRGEITRLEIGSNNMIREYVTMNPGTEGGGGLTRVGDGNLFMMMVHVGHDCMVGNNIVFANSVALGGHAVIGDNAVIGGLAGIHQFCRIGRGAMIGTGSSVVTDVIPYGSVVSPRGSLGGLNLVGLKRRGADKDDMNGLRAAYKALFAGEGTLMERARKLEQDMPDNPLVQDVLEFIFSASERSFCTPD